MQHVADQISTNLEFLGLNSLAFSVRARTLVGKRQEITVTIKRDFISLDMIRAMVTPYQSDAVFINVVREDV